MTEQIINTKWGVANVFSDGTIEIHEDLNLPEYSDLKERILKHEQDHDFKKGFIYNLSVDMIPKVSTFSLLKFMITRPKTWIQLLPFYWRKDKGFIYDKNILFFWLVILSFTLIAIKLIGGLI